MPGQGGIGGQECTRMTAAGGEAQLGHDDGGRATTDTRGRMGRLSASTRMHEGAWGGCQYPHSSNAAGKDAGDATAGSRHIASGSG